MLQRGTSIAYIADTTSIGHPTWRVTTLPSLFERQRSDRWRSRGLGKANAARRWAGESTRFNGSASTAELIPREPGQYWPGGGIYALGQPKFRLSEQPKPSHEHDVCDRSDDSCGDRLQDVR